MAALGAVPPSAPLDTLLHQLTHLRLCLDAVTAQHAAEAAAGAPAGGGGASGGGDAWAGALAGRLQLQGRARQPAPPLQ